MDEIVIDRGEAPTMNFDEDEQRLWDEIEISKKKKSNPLKRPGSRQAPPMDDMMMDDELDAFANPMKQQEEKPPEPMFGNQQVGYDDDEMPDYQSEAGSIMRQPQIEKPSTGYFSVDDEKADLLNKLTRLEGFHYKQAFECLFRCQ
jgi:hypothetical protein